jgi:hypothetical protein
MTHPITPPPELVQQWIDDLYNEPGQFVSSDDKALAARAAQWGADQELEACCEWVGKVAIVQIADNLRAARRPKPPNLKELAIAELDKVDMLWDTTEFSQETLHSLDTIRRALEALPE